MSMNDDKMLNWAWKIIVIVALIDAVGLFILDIIFLYLLDLPNIVYDDVFYSGLHKIILDISFNILVALVAYKAFRHKERWSWFGLWLFPFYQISAGIIVAVFQFHSYGWQRVIMGILGIIALIMSYKSFFSKS